MMKRYTLRQEYKCCMENGTPIKDCAIQINVSEEGIDKRQVLDLFSTIACGYVRFLGEETGAYEKMGDWKKPDIDVFNIN
jgi:hypothetical protein